MVNPTIRRYNQKTGHRNARLIVRGMKRRYERRLRQNGPLPYLLCLPPAARPGGYRNRAGASGRRKLLKNPQFMRGYWQLWDKTVHGRWENWRMEAEYVHISC